jgi:hypothetical protein
MQVFWCLVFPPLLKLPAYGRADGRADGVWLLAETEIFNIQVFDRLRLTNGVWCSRLR